MTDLQRYLFDLQGFLVVPDVLSADECDIAIAKISERLQPMAKTPDGYDSHGTWSAAGNLLAAGEPFLGLIDHPKLMAVLTEIIGPLLRLENCYSFVRSKGCPPFEMHGGYHYGGVNFRYDVIDGKIRTGLTVVSLSLQEVAVEDGGFACIPGSHKSLFRVPAEQRQELFAVGGPLVRNIAAPKGAAIIFTETLAHGAASWQGETPRYGLFYKYNDRAAVYHGQENRRPDAATLAQMTDNQRCFFNRAWQAFGPENRSRNDAPEF